MAVHHADQVTVISFYLPLQAYAEDRVDQHVSVRQLLFHFCQRQYPAADPAVVRQLPVIFPCPFPRVAAADDKWIEPVLFQHPSDADPVRAVVPHPGDDEHALSRAGLHDMFRHKGRRRFHQFKGRYSQYINRISVRRFGRGACDHHFVLLPFP